MPEKKYFSLEEANRLLPVVKVDLFKLREIRELYKQKFNLYHKMRTAPGGDGAARKEQLFTLESELDFLQIEANAHMQNIAAKGAELKDIDHGLIDFPARIDGQEVLLCWKSGEAEIAYYHTETDGFAGRKPLRN